MHVKYLSLILLLFHANPIQASDLQTLIEVDNKYSLFHQRYREIIQQDQLENTSENFQNVSEIDDSSIDSETESSSKASSIMDIMENTNKSWCNLTFHQLVSLHDVLHDLLHTRRYQDNKLYDPVTLPFFSSQALVDSVDSLVHMAIRMSLKCMYGTITLNKSKYNCGPAHQEIILLKSHVDAKIAIITDQQALLENLRVFHKSYFHANPVLSQDSYTILKLFKSMNIKSKCSISVGKLFHIFNQFSFKHLKLLCSNYTYITILNEIYKLKINVESPSTPVELVFKHILFVSDNNDKMTVKKQPCIHYTEWIDNKSIIRLFNKDFDNL